MRKRIWLGVVVGLCVAMMRPGDALGGSSDASAGTLPQPLVQAHAHNDYEHRRPLLDALDKGFCSFEADVYLVGGELLVAHNRTQVQPSRTLQSLYLNPLRERAMRNQGRIFPGGPECTLLIDIKEDWKTTYPVLRHTLETYAEILTTFEGGKRTSRAILVVLSGNRSKEMFAGEKTRLAAYDGQLSDLESGEPADLIPWISANWYSQFKWRGEGEFPPLEAAKLAGIVTKAHAQGRRVRFWGGPDQKDFWSVLRNHKVDLINTDDLGGLALFLAEK
jgi:hypothetical protein